MSMPRLCAGSGSLCKVKVILMVGILALMANYLLFLQFRAVTPRSLLIVLKDKNEDTTITSALLPQTLPAARLPPSHHPSAGDAHGNVNTGDEAARASVAKISNTSLPLAPAENAAEQAEGGPEKSGTDGVNKPRPDGVKLSEWRQGKELNISSAATPKELPVCPEKPNDLVGRMKTHLEPIEMSRVEEIHIKEVTKGGNHQPEDCRAREKLAIVIPCRNREQHLAILLHNILPTLIRQRLNFTIFVIDQDMPTTFNRGMLFNVGYLEALKRDHYDCFIFHDVDMIPTNDHCFYRCTHNPRHFIGALSKWHYGLLYNKYYGGVVSFTAEQYRKINGGSNLYFGWGGEDDDLRMRVLNKGYSLVRYPKAIGRYDTPSHKRDSGNGDNPERFQLIRTTKSRQDKEGLSTTVYKVSEFVESPLFTRIRVAINMTQVLKDFPDLDLLAIRKKKQQKNKQKSKTDKSQSAKINGSRNIPAPPRI